MTSSVIHRPRISVVTASLNAGKTIERTLQSIDEQMYPNLQLICIDGNSTDETAAIIRSYKHLVSVFVQEKDKNVADAINKGFALADGDIFCYLNADDAFANGALDLIARKFDENPGVDIVTGGCLRVFADGSRVTTRVPSNFLEVISLRNDVEQPSTFWRASIHRRLGQLDDSFQLAFDWEWWNRIHASGARFLIVPDVLSLYYFSADNLTSRAGQRIIDEMYRITKAYGPSNGRIADVYKFLFSMFDMRGYYDQPFAKLSPARKFLFGVTLKTLYRFFGKQAINSYNWNWASKQIRNITWYK